MRYPLETSLGAAGVFPRQQDDRRGDLGSLVVYLCGSSGCFTRMALHINCLMSANSRASTLPVMTRRVETVFGLSHKLAITILAVRLSQLGNFVLQS